MRNFHDFINLLEQEGELIRIKEFVNPILEISEITDRFSKQKKGGFALLFENTGTKFPVLTNAFGSDKRIAIALEQTSLDNLSNELNELFTNLLKPRNSFLDKISGLGQLKNLSHIFPKYVKKASCQEVVIKNPDLNIFPVLKTWPEDGGRFITLPLVHTISFENGIRNTGMYRMQVFDKNTTGMHWHKHKTGAAHFLEYKKAKKKMPVAVSLGGHPAVTYAATAPLPEGIDEFLLAGFLMKKPVKLVKCLTNDIFVPADAEIILEGYIDPEEDFAWEGPFGDHTGFYSEPDFYPKFHITCITHKKNAIYPATVVGIPPQEDAYLAKATEKIFLPLIKKSIAPEIEDMYLPEAGVAHNFTIVKIQKNYDGQAQKVMNSLWGNGQMALNKCLFVSDKNIDIRDIETFARENLKNFNPETDIFYSYGPMDVLEHASEKFTYGSKIGFDFTNNQKQQTASPYPVNQDILKNFEFVINYNSLLDKNIPVLIISVKKIKRIFDIFDELSQKIDFSAYKIIIFTDYSDIFDLYNVAWLTGSNIDPKRDTKIINNILIVDATEKNFEIDKFERNWPEKTIMDKKTIESVDKKWTDLFDIEMIKSPSLKFYD